MGGEGEKGEIKLRTADLVLEWSLKSRRLSRGPPRLPGEDGAQNTGVH